jgi:hypothetical protein
MERWVRTFSSFAREGEADAEFWESMSGDERVEVVNQMRREAAARDGKPDERLRRVVRVVEPKRR